MIISPRKGNCGKVGGAAPVFVGFFQLAEKTMEKNGKKRP